jgi:RNA polymerase sigma factor (sigma-70 family)
LEDEDFAALFASARGGDQSSWGRIISSFTPHLRSLLKREMFSKSKRAFGEDDVIQETFARVLARQSTFASNLRADEFMAILKRTTRHTLIEMVRRHKDQAWSNAPQSDIAASTPTSGPVTQSDDIRKLERAISNLPSAYLETLRLHLIEQRDDRWIANHLGVGHETIRKRIRRGIEMIEADLRRSQINVREVPRDFDEPTP